MIDVLTPTQQAAHWLHIIRDLLAYVSFLVGLMLTALLAFFIAWWQRPERRS